MGRPFRIVLDYSKRVGAFTPLSVLVTGPEDLEQGPRTVEDKEDSSLNYQLSALLGEWVLFPGKDGESG